MWQILFIIALIFIILGFLLMLFSLCKISSIQSRIEERELLKKKIQKESKEDNLS